MNHTSRICGFFGRILILIGLTLFIVLPRILSGWWYLGQAQQYAAIGSNKQASTAFEDAAIRLFWMNGIYEQAAQTAWLGGESVIGLRLFESGIVQDGLSSKGWISLGDLHFQAGRTEPAIEAWTQIDEGSVDFGAAHSRIARAYFLLENYHKALDNWRLVLSKEPQNSEAHYILGLILMTEKPSEAVSELMMALSMDQSLEEKVQVLRQGLNIATLQDNLAYQLVVSGQTLAMIGEWRLAQEAFLQATLVESDFPEAWAWLGEAYQHTGKDGFPALQKALLLDQNSATSLALIGLYYRRQNQIDLARTAYAKAANLEPENPAWQLALGDLLAQQGDLINALVYYQKGVDLSPKDPLSWRALALFCVQYDVDNAKLGMQAALQLLKLAPDDWRSHDIMGQVMMSNGDQRSAEIYFKRAIEIAADQAEPYLHLGYLFLQMEDRADAYDNLIKAQHLDEQGSIGWQAQRLLDQYFP
jgi:tetratricopeptide (TPR) repeat protein